MQIGIEKYSIDAELDTPQANNHLTVKFLIWGLATESRDYQPIIDKLQALCKEFNSASTLPPANENYHKKIAVQMSTEQLIEEVKKQITDQLEKVISNAATCHTMT